MDRPTHTWKDLYGMMILRPDGRSELVRMGTAAVRASANATVQRILEAGEMKGPYMMCHLLDKYEVPYPRLNEGSESRQMPTYVVSL